MTTMTIDPVLEELAELEADLDLPPIHRIDVCRGCEDRAVVGAIVKCRCGHVKAIEGYLPHPDWVSCRDCQEHDQPACGFCGKQRGEVY